MWQYNPAVIIFTINSETEANIRYAAEPAGDKSECALIEIYAWISAADL